MGEPGRLQAADDGSGPRTEQAASTNLVMPRRLGNEETRGNPPTHSPHQSPSVSDDGGEWRRCATNGSKVAGRASFTSANYRIWSRRAASGRANGSVGWLGSTSIARPSFPLLFK